MPSFTYRIPMVDEYYFAKERILRYTRPCMHTHTHLHTYLCITYSFCRYNGTVHYNGTNRIII